MKNNGINDFSQDPSKAEALALLSAGAALASADRVCIECGRPDIENGECIHCIDDAEDRMPPALGPPSLASQELAICSISVAIFEALDDPSLSCRPSEDFEHRMYITDDEEQFELEMAALSLEYKALGNLRIYARSRLRSRWSENPPEHNSGTSGLSAYEYSQVHRIGQKINAAANEAIEKIDWSGGFSADYGRLIVGIAYSRVADGRALEWDASAV